MRQTLFFIPHEFWGLPVFGMGWLLLLWIGGCVFALRTISRRGGTREELRSFFPFAAIVAVVIWWVLPRVEVAGQGLPIRGYGVFLLLATVSGVLLAIWRAKRVGLSPDAIISLAFHRFVGGIVGARVFFVIQYWNPPPPAVGIYEPDSVIRTLSNMVNFVEGGLVVYGSLIGALFAAVWYLRRQQLPLLAVADLVAPSLALGLAIGRMGCLMNGCCYGGVTDDSWALTFPPQSPPYYDQHRTGLLYGFLLGENESGAPIIAQVIPEGVASGKLEVGEVLQAVGSVPVQTPLEAQVQLGRSGGSVRLKTSTRSVTLGRDVLPVRSLPVHPTQVYSAINALLLCGFTLAHFPYRRRDGETFLLLMGLYGVSRFLLEIIRTDEHSMWNTGMTISQNVSVIMLTSVVLLAIYIGRQPLGSAWPQPETTAAGST